MRSIKELFEQHIFHYHYYQLVRELFKRPIPLALWDATGAVAKGILLLLIVGLALMV